MKFIEYQTNVMVKQKKKITEGTVRNYYKSAKLFCVMNDVINVEFQLILTKYFLNTNRDLKKHIINFFFKHQEYREIIFNKINNNDQFKKELEENFEKEQ